MALITELAVPALCYPPPDYTRANYDLLRLMFMRLRCTDDDLQYWQRYQIDGFDSTFIDDKSDETLEMGELHCFDGDTFAQIQIFTKD